MYSEGIIGAAWRKADDFLNVKVNETIRKGDVLVLLQKKHRTSERSPSHVLVERFRKLPLPPQRTDDVGDAVAIGFVSAWNIDVEFLQDVQPDTSLAARLNEHGEWLLTKYTNPPRARA